MFKKIFKYITVSRIIIFSLVAVALWFVVWGDKGVYQREKLRYLNSKLEKDKQNLLIEIKRLQEEKKLLSDKNMLENTIRRELGYIKPGEKIFELKDVPNTNGSGNNEGGADR